MNRIVTFTIFFALACILGACSSSGPAVTQATISDPNPVVGQRVQLQVYAQTDNPTLQYTWHCDSGIFQSSTGSVTQDVPTSLFSVYWIPTSANNTSPTCTITDSEDNQETVTFSTTVKERVPQIKLNAGSGLVLLTKDYNALMGGILAGIANQNIRYYSATAETDFGWGQSVFPWVSSDSPLSTIAMYLYSSYYYSLTYVWAVFKDSTGVWKLIAHGASSDTPYDCPFVSSGPDGVSAVTKAAINSSIIWVGTDKGLYDFSTSSQSWAPGPVELATGVTTVAINDIYAANARVYVATDAGVFFTTDNGGTWSPFANPNRKTSSITGYKDPDTGTIHIYALTASTDGGEPDTIKQFKDDGNLPSPAISQPLGDSWIKSVDTDPQGHVWFGKHVWDVAHNIVDPADLVLNLSSLAPFDESIDHIIKSMVSPEGLVYMQTDLGRLIVWGK